MASFKLCRCYGFTRIQLTPTDTLRLIADANLKPPRTYLSLIVKVLITHLSVILFLGGEPSEC